MSYFLVWPVALLGLVSCSQGPVSTLRSATSSRGDTNVLYWQEKTDLFRGVCATGLPVNRVNCTGNIVKLAITDLSKRAMDMGKRGADVSATEIAAEIKSLKASDPTIASLTQQVNALTQQKSAVEASVTALTSQLEADKKVKAQTDEQLAYDQQQLAVVESRLGSTPSDEVLLTLKRQLNVELLQLQAKLEEIAPRIQSIGQRLMSLRSILTKVVTDLAAKQDELKNYADTLDVYSPKLEQLKAEQSLAQAKYAAVPKVLEYIGTTDVIYRGAIWPIDMQGAFALVERAFGGLFLMTQGSYKLLSGNNTFCPQKVEIVADNKLKVDFLSPCISGVVLTCENDVCSSTSYSFKPVVTIQDATHYEYTQYDRKDIGIFVWDK